MVNLRIPLLFMLGALQVASSNDGEQLQSDLNINSGAASFPETEEGIETEDVDRELSPYGYGVRPSRPGQQFSTGSVRGYRNPNVFVQPPPRPQPGFNFRRQPFPPPKGRAPPKGAFRGPPPKKNGGFRRGPKKGGPKKGGPKKGPPRPNNVQTQSPNSLASALGFIRLPDQNVVIIQDQNDAIVVSGGAGFFNPPATTAPTAPVAPSEPPTRAPTRTPTQNPTRTPTQQPTRNPTRTPTREPTRRPTRDPTRRPTRRPTRDPTRKPTNRPTRAPTRKPTRTPTKFPTKSPTKSPT